MLHEQTAEFLENYDDIDRGRLSDIFPLGVSLPIFTAEAASIDPLRSKEGHSRREQSDDYFQVVALLNDRWRVIVCKDGIQWVLQSRRKLSPIWDGRSYCMTKNALLRCIRETGTGEIHADALADLNGLPDHI